MGFHASHIFPLPENQTFFAGGDECNQTTHLCGPVQQASGVPPAPIGEAY